MSAWMTSEKHVNTLATYAYVEGLTLDPATLAKRLTLENVRSLLARYEGRYADMFEGWEDRTYKPVNLARVKREACEAYRAKLEGLRSAPTTSKTDLATFVLKQAACFDYQACEHPGWQDSEAERHDRRHH